ncbi:MAG: hypothetical protein PHS93_08275 [Candidatus Omnitrophica bacterium]|nr:hypothetical protein [Candidatus Omnitrophota bacterium]MDD5589128.1 hypothetical protein [Candidatus Nanoarchaeia archaeon]
MPRTKKKSSGLRSAYDIASNRKFTASTNIVAPKTSNISKNNTIPREQMLRKYARAVTTTGVAEYYNPLFQESSLMLPSKIREINQQCRHYFRTDALVSAAINFHSEFAINGISNKCEDKKVKKYFDEMAFDVIKLPNLLSFMALEWYKIGNIFPYGIWDENKGRWSRFITLNPDYVEIEKILFSDEPTLKLDPDEGLKRIVQNKSPRKLYDQLDPQMIAYISKGQKIPLSSMIIETDDEDFEFPQVCHIARKASQYEVYGTPLIMAALKVLIYKDLLRNAQFAIARRHWKPIKLVKVGDDTHEPNSDILDSVEEAVRYADSDVNGWIVWNHYINVEYIASAGHVMPLDGEYKYNDLELMRALEISDAVLTNQGMTFANASVSLRVMVNKYMRFQKLLSDFIENFIYKPVAKVQGFYKTNDEGEQELIYPKIEWELTRLQDDAQLKTVLQAMQQKQLISKHTLLTYMGIDYTEERKLIQGELEDERQMPTTSTPATTKPTGKGDQLGLPFPETAPAGGAGTPPVGGGEKGGLPPPLAPGAPLPGTPAGTPPIPVELK